MGRNRTNSLKKLRFYSAHLLTQLMPHRYWESQRAKLLSAFDIWPPADQQDILSRVHYYNREHRSFTPDSQTEVIGQFSGRGKSSAYSNDFRTLISYFPRSHRVGYLFGDITEVPAFPRFVKSRPITAAADNANSILLKLNTIRHYQFHPDPLSFADKHPMAVWRGKSNRQHRIDFATRFVDHPLCNVGCTLHKEAVPERYHRPFMSVSEQLTYKYIVSVEGIDVATNLKWIMASNSLCLMRRPRFETWFMEGTLEPGRHYVELAEDFSDLPEKIRYYEQHPEEAEAIIRQAQQHVARFMNPAKERLIALMVMEKYFQLSGQCQPHRILSRARSANPA